MSQSDSVSDSSSHSSSVVEVLVELSAVSAYTMPVSIVLSGCGPKWRIVTPHAHARAGLCDHCWCPFMYMCIYYIFIQLLHIFLLLIE